MRGGRGPATSPSGRGRTRTRGGLLLAGRRGGRRGLAFAGGREDEADVRLDKEAAADKDADRGGVEGVAGEEEPAGGAPPRRTCTEAFGSAAIRCSIACTVRSRSCLSSVRPFISAGPQPSHLRLLRPAGRARRDPSIRAMRGLYTIDGRVGVGMRPRVRVRAARQPTQMPREKRQAYQSWKARPTKRSAARTSRERRETAHHPSRRKQGSAMSSKRARQFAAPCWGR